MLGKRLIFIRKNVRLDQSLLFPILYSSSYSALSHWNLHPRKGVTVLLKMVYSLSLFPSCLRRIGMGIRSRVRVLLSLCFSLYQRHGDSSLTSERQPKIFDEVPIKSSVMVPYGRRSRKET